MARNKYPEQTVERILAASTKLFMRKGYEKTTVQDILEELKLSKGAIYHHFKSKEEILSVVIEHWLQREVALVTELSARVSGTNGKEKMQNLMIYFFAGATELYGPGSEDFFLVQSKNRQLMMSRELSLTGVSLWMRDIAPIFAKLIEEGVSDGSFKTDHPLETAEMLIVLLGAWVKPTMYDRSEKQTRQRLYALKDMLQKLGVDILTDTMIENLIAGYTRLHFFSESET